MQSQIMDKMLALKKARRAELAALSFTEKIAIIEKMRDRSLQLANNPLRRRPAPNARKS
ncbi:MAG TPA: hypothetical protein VH413_18900 [Verrucomicrobiae bacterium]|nr:hypothetical protein [Verrucomicrobiae bacterium]